MSAVGLVLIALVAFFLAYRFYGGFLATFFGVDPAEEVPSESRYDGVDYVPAKHWLVLFGHHFSSIAGAAPIIGPVIAIGIWGWGGVFLWILLGSIFIGGLHDFASLMVSVKTNARSIADISSDVISKRAKFLFLLFVFLTLLLVVAVFAYLSAKTFVEDSRVILPSLGLIPVAILLGFLLYRTRLNQGISAAIGLMLLAMLIILSGRASSLFDFGSFGFWLAIFLIYAYVASITPVHILLQPRDYLSSFLLFFGMLAGYIGIFWIRPSVNLPVYTSWQVGDKPLWPMLFVIVACGAISGFHSLISSGTTARQLPNQRYAQRIGYGAMLAEGALAVLALVCCISSYDGMETYAQLLKKAGPIAVFSKGFGYITSPIFGGYGAVIGVLILNAFILTTLDTATRITRYIFEELSGVSNRWITSLVVVFLAGILAWSGKWQAIWPTFGAANQLVATLALFVISCWLLSRNKSYYFSFVLGLFMLATTVSSLLIQGIQYYRESQWLLLGISSFLVFLALYVFKEVVSILLRTYRYRAEKNVQGGG